MKRKYVLIITLLIITVISALIMWITPYINTSNDGEAATVTVARACIDARNSERYVDFLVLYTEDLERNPYGYELLIEEDTGFVIDADSRVNITEDTFVLSGHGEAAVLLRNAELGDVVTVSGDDVTIVRDIRSSSIKRIELAAEAADEVEQYKRNNLFDIDYDTVEELDEIINKGLAELRLYCGEDDADDQIIAEIVNEILLITEYKYYCCIESNAVEGRGMWHRPNNTCIDESTLDGVKEFVSYIAELGINTLYVETYWHGMTTYYSEALLSQHPRVADYDYGEYGNDYLLALIGECHKRGIEVHAWVELLRVGKKEWDIPKHIDGEWIFNGLSEEGDRFLDPANKEVTEYLLLVMDEMLTKYDLDGVSYDYLRYSGGEDEASVNNSEKIKAINTVISTLSARIRSIDKDIVISASPYGYIDEALAIYMQDIRAWITNGDIDVVLPMIYTENTDLLMETVEEYYAVSDKVIQFTGIAPLYNGSSILKSQVIVESVKNCNASGYALFASQSYLTGDKHQDGEIMRAMKAGANRVKAISPSADIKEVLEVWLNQLEDRCSRIYYERMSGEEKRCASDFCSLLREALEKSSDITYINELVEGFAARVLEFENKAVSKRLSEQSSQILKAINLALIRAKREK